MNHVHISDEPVEHYLERISVAVEGLVPLERVLFYQELNVLLSSHRRHQSWADILAELQKEGVIEGPLNIPSAPTAYSAGLGGAVYSTIDSFLDRCMKLDEEHIAQVREYLLAEEYRAGFDLISSRSG